MGDPGVAFAGVGSASITSVYFSGLHSSGQTRALIVSLVVIGITTVCLGAVRLLPRAAAVHQHG